MICKKCGANTADASKFCGSCGNQVEQPQTQEISVQNNEQSNELVEIINSSEKDISNIQQNNLNSEINEVISEATLVNTQNEANINPNVVSNQQPQRVQQPVKNDNKNNMWIFIIIGAVLFVLSAVLLFVIFNKLSKSSVNVLEKAMYNLSQKGENSATIRASVLLESSTLDTLNLSFTSKYQKLEDKCNLALTLDKSLLYDEISLYSTITEEDIILYAQSSLIDMLGYTYSDNNMWLYYFANLTDSIDITELEDEIEMEDIDLAKLIDNKHFKYIDKKDGIAHYQLIIDNELLEKIKSQTSEEVHREINSYTEEQVTLTDTIAVDIYINDSDEFVKISIDLASYLEESEISKAVVSIEFLDLNSTTVVIPEDALYSVTDLETYMTTYSLDDSHTDYNYDLDYDYDYDYSY